MKVEKGLMRKLHCGVVVLALLFSFYPASGAQPFDLTLTQALGMAMECGPAFRDHARTAARYRLDGLADELAHRPTWRLTAGATVAPDFNPGAQANMNWQLSESLSLNVNVPVGAPVAAPPGSGTPRDTISLNWSQTLWPGDDKKLQSEMDEREQHIAALDRRETYMNAVTDVIRDFYRLEQAAASLDLAERRLSLAEGQAAHALQRYERGEIGLTALQDEQRRHHQARIALQDATLAEERAYNQLMTSLGGTHCSGSLYIQAPTALQLHDDLPWDKLVAHAAELLDVPAPVAVRDQGMRVTQDLQGSEWEAKLLTFNLPYQRAVMSRLQSERTLALAEDALLPSIGANASIGTDFQDEAPRWSIRLQGTWDLDPTRRIARDKAQLAEDGAQDQLEQARVAALEAGQSAWLAVSDAMYGLELAATQVAEAEQTLDIVLRRVEAGLAPAIEIEQARLEVDRRRGEYAQARGDLWLAWLHLGHRLGVDIGGLLLLNSSE